MVPLGDAEADAAMQQTHWRFRGRLSSMGDALDAFLAASASDRGPWLSVAFAAGIAAWFVLKTPFEWAAVVALALAAATAAAAGWRNHGSRGHLRLAAMALALTLAGGVATVWSKSELAGAVPIARPMFGEFEGTVLRRIEQPAEQRVRLVLATREPGTGRAIKVRVNVPLDLITPASAEGAVVRLKARLMPPAPPMLPGGYDFARAAWFDGLTATGAALSPIEVIEPAPQKGSLARFQRWLADHVRDHLSGSPGAIAAAFASGDRGAIDPADEDAMRDAGLTHLLSISGLHVSAVIAATYLIAIRLLALWPWLALRVRLPVAAAGAAALAGIFYTLLTGAEVPTVRSCIGAVLVLLALALGREPLSLRMIAIGAFFVLLLWPEALVGPSFQMSFAAVIAIVALHNCAPARAFLAPRGEGLLVRIARHGAMLLVTGFAIEIALMPIVLFHFHRAGIYGAFANVIAIPLTTFVSMPLIALALLFDTMGLGAPFWWLAGKSLELLLWIAHFTAAQPGAVRLMPQMGGMAFALFLIGGLWLGLWRGRVRLLGVVPLVLASGLLAMSRAPDILITGDGRHVGITGEGVRLLVLRETTSDFTSENLRELAGMEGEMLTLDRWPGADCSADFCVTTLRRGRRDWRLLLARSRAQVSERELAAACDRADIVVADRMLPNACRPAWIKADLKSLRVSGGLAIYLAEGEVRSVADAQGEHGWWRGAK
ncbi:MAG: ComEC/Rec2 family competence protein [Candidatus Andeanibacterium colombiense]|uniref:ComEC/Rec2 family competence protein n=1 Tax=Candidatus Andeanibacterium colombiense TaxID=3121345 RepID=A0AAJ5X394_9SPHN|nr:MAG: ComEC/Rec2 family competence protein [Sphingomonadaceae bacterium]